jgi:glutamate-1-semialdehyde 2,1-aminomutase
MPDIRNRLNRTKFPKTAEVNIITKLNLSKSLAMQEQAAKRIPGMTQLLSKRPDQFSRGVWPGYFSRAKGAEIWDLDGNKYIDMSIGGIGANILGYADPDVDRAVCDAIEGGVSSSLNCPEEVELAELLCEIHPWAEKVRYARTGGEAMAIAVRIARAYSGKDKVGFCGYHGWHDWYLAANLGTENALGEHLLPGLEPRGVPRCLIGTALPFSYNQIDELEKIIGEQGDKLGAVIMEPIRNDAPNPGFLEGVKDLAKQCDAVFIFDEISSGFRMNSGGAHMNFGVMPDIAVFSKAIGNGYPAAAIIGTGEVMDATQSTFISSTNWTERIGPTAALATIKKHITVKAGNHLVKIGKMVQDGWKKHSKVHNLNIDVGGIYPMSHFNFEYQNGLAIKSLFVQMMLERGFLASTAFYAMYAHTSEHVRDYLIAVDEVFSNIASLIEADRIEESLEGRPAVAGFKRLT